MRSSLSLVTLVLALAVASVVADSCITSLYMGDPFSKGISFASGRASSVLQGGQLRNAGTDFDVLLYNGKPYFRIAPEGSRTGSVVDLGSLDAIEQQYYLQTAPTGSTYSSIQYVKGVLSINTNSTTAFQPMDPNIETLLKQFNSSTLVPVQASHIYIAATTNPSMTIKFYFPDVYSNTIVLRWDVLQGSSGACAFNPDQGTTILATGNMEHSPTDHTPAGLYVSVVIVCVLALIAVGLSVVAIGMVVLLKRKTYDSIQ
jgi:hypothetical protein